MAVRLRPQSSAWLAPTALAAQLTAQTGQIAGQGVAGLLGGIAQGVGAFTQKREQRRVEAINESRYQDSLRMRQADDARQDRSFQYGAIQDNVTALKQYLTGKDLEVALSAAKTGTPDPAKVAERDTAMASLNRMQAEASNVAGVRPVELPMPTAQTPATTPTPGAQVAPGAGPDPEGFSKSLMSLDDPGLNDLTGKVVSKIEDLEMEFESYKQYGPKAAAQIAETRSALARARGHLVSIKAEAQRRESEKQQTRKAEELKAQEESRMRVGAADDARTAEANKSQDAAAIASMQADLEKRGIKETLPADITTARTVYRDLVVTDPNSEMNARRKAEASKVRADNQKSLEALRQAGRKEMEDIRARNREPAAAAKAAQDAINNQESVVGTLMKEYDLLKKLREKGLIAEDDEDLAAAYGNFAAAKAKYMGMVSGGAPATGAPASAPTASADPMSKAEAEYNALPDAEKTPEAAARIAAKYGIK